MTRDDHAFTDIIEQARSNGPRPMAVAHPCSPEALQGAVEAAEQGIATPILIAPRAKLTKLAASLDIDLGRYETIDVEHSHAAAERAVELVREGFADSLMKGSLHTDELMAAVLAPGSGLKTERRISHIFALDVPTYHKPLFITDAAINIYPTLDEIGRAHV